MGIIKKVLVIDGYQTAKIVSILSGLYARKAKVLNGNICAARGEAIDLFFISARQILRNKLQPEELIADCGTPQSKVVAISVVKDYLEKLDNKMDGVHYTYYEAPLISISTLTFNDLPLYDKLLLMSFLEK